MLHFVCAINEISICCNLATLLILLTFFFVWMRRYYDFIVQNALPSSNIVTMKMTWYFHLRHNTMKMLENAESNEQIKLKSFNYLVKTVRRERTSLSGISTYLLKCFRLVLSVQTIFDGFNVANEMLTLQQYSVIASNFICRYVLRFQMHLINVKHIQTIIDFHCKLMLRKC